MLMRSIREWVNLEFWVGNDVGMGCTPHKVKISYSTNIIDVKVKAHDLENILPYPVNVQCHKSLSKHCKLECNPFTFPKKWINHIHPNATLSFNLDDLW